MGRLIFELEREKYPMHVARAKQHPYISGMRCHLEWITKTFWTFLVKHMSASYRKTALTPVDGEELSGLGLWRVLCINHEEGACEVECAALGALHDFPACPSTTCLPQYPGMWRSLVQE